MKPRARARELTTVIGEGTVINGTFNVRGGTRVDGMVQGKLTCTDTLVVSRTGIIEAEVNVKNAKVEGRVIGNMTALEGVELESGSVFVGDLKTKILLTHEGAVFNGKCIMETKGFKKPLDKKQVVEAYTKP